MKVYKNLTQWQKERDQLNGTKIGFVPTMGALHEGHKSLIKKCVQENEATVLSVFLNPTQFNNPSDLQEYPKTLKEDMALAQESGVTHLLTPSYQDLYPDNYNYMVIEKELSQHFCGKSRPGFFEGILTVVTKLLNIVRADRAYFGEKDYQQVLLVKGLVDAFFIPTQIVACPLVREHDGLAVSSRNQRLTPEQRELATKFNQILKAHTNKEKIKSCLSDEGFLVDYVEVFDNRILAAVTIDEIRLIDNVPC